MSNRFKFLKDPKFQVGATWVWNLLGVMLISTIITRMLPADTVLNSEALQANPDLIAILVFTEILVVGLLPMLFTMLNREKPANYGLQKKGLLKSLGFSALVVLVFFIFLSTQFGEVTTTLRLAGLHFTTPWKVGLALLVILAYGPLETFFVLWLIDNTDKVYHSGAKLLSSGLIVTILLYGVLHSFSQGLYALIIAVNFLALGAIYKTTRNAIGPMVAWTVMNEFIWVLCGILLAG